MTEQLVTVAQAARILGVKAYPVLRAVEAGDLPAGRIGRVIVIPAREVIAYARRVVDVGV